MNESIRRELLALKADDLALRARLEQEGRLYRGYDPEMEALHRRNADRLKAIVAEHGWPGRALAGDDGAEASWLIAQHDIAEPAFQRQCLQWVQDAVSRGDAAPWQPAYLIDRIRMFEGWPQIYGTQMAPDDQGEIVVWPIADRYHLNERRRAVGLPMFEERRVPPAPDVSHARERTTRGHVDTWARKVGWRHRILHVTAEGDWTVSQRAGTYRAESLASEGFIHCSEPQQVVWVANRRFRNRQDLVLLHIDIRKLTSQGRYENLEGGTQLFPHVYGPINLESIMKVTPFRPGPAGDFDDDDLAAVY